MCDEVKVAMAQLSLAVGAVQVTVRAQVPAATFCVISDGMPLMVGLMLSLIVIVNDPLAMFPFTSVAV